MKTENWYEASGAIPSITAIKVIRETADFIITIERGRERRIKKASDRYACFKTFEEAKRFLVKDAEANLNLASFRLDRCISRLKKVSLLSEEDVLHK